MSVCWDDDKVDVYNRHDAVTVATSLLKQAADKQVLIIGDHICYDLAVLAVEAGTLTFMQLIMRALAYDGVSCTRIREMLIDIAHGMLKKEEDDEGNITKVGYALDEIANRRLGIKVEKNREIRLGFGPLRDVPIAEYPQRFIDYVKLDADVAKRVRIDQDKDGELIRDECAQVRKDFSLFLSTCWGLRTDKESVVEFERSLHLIVDKLRKELEPTGMLRPDGSKNMAVIEARVTAAYKGKPPLTKGGKTGKRKAQTSRLVLEESEDKTLLKFAKWGKSQKLLTSFLPALWRGVKAPLNPNYNVLVETGRCSAFAGKDEETKSLNIQQLPRAVGARECFVPRVVWRTVEVPDDYVLKEGEHFE